MIYRKLGNTGVKLSILGFGCMRLPEIKVGAKQLVDEDKAIPMIRHGIDQGINYVDSAYFYNHGLSEIVLGKALKDGYRQRVWLSTKIPTGDIKKTDDFDRLLDEQLEKLSVQTIDFYHFHYLNKSLFEEKVIGLKLIDRAQRAKTDGRIGHISFSFHDKPEVLKQIIDSGWFETMLVQYNLLDRSNEEMIRYAFEKGIGVNIMGPVGGGRLGEPSEIIQKLHPDQLYSTVEIALKFVFSNPAVTCALSGMENMEMVNSNVKVASKSALLTAAELENINQLIIKYQALADLYCTGCSYCMPCPHEVNIPLNFKLMNYEKIYQITNYAREQYQMIGNVPWMPGKTAGACVECGECEPKCPQHIPIIKQLKEVAAVFESD